MQLITIHDPGCDSSNKESASVCVNDIHGLKSIPKELTKDKPDSKFYLFFGFMVVTSQYVFNTSFVGKSNYFAGEWRKGYICKF